MYRFFPRGASAVWSNLALVLEAVSAVALLAASSFLIARASEQPPILHLMMAIVGVRAFAVGRGVFRYLQRLGMHDTVLNHMALVRPQMFKAFAAKPVGVGSAAIDLESATGDSDRVQDFVLKVWAPFLQVLSGTITAATLILVWYSVAGVVALALMVCIMGLTFLLSFNMSHTQQLSRRQLAFSLRQQLAEYLANIDLLSNYELSASRRSKISQLANQISRVDFKFGISTGVVSALLGFGAVLTVASAGYLAALYPEGNPGFLVVVAMLTPLAAFEIANQLGGAAITLGSSLTSLREVGKSLDQPRTQDSGLTLSSASVLELKNATISRQGRTLIPSVSLTLCKSDVQVLMGKSGIGKTSLAYVLAGLEPSPSGYLIDGQPANRFSRESISRRVLLIEQQPHVFRGTVEENLKVAGDHTEEAMRNALEVVGLGSEIKDRGGLKCELETFGANLSGGQVQRLAIARALLFNSDFIIFDEPTSGLDWENAQRLIALLHELEQRGKGIVVITHDQEFAKQFSNVRLVESLSE